MPTVQDAKRALVQAIQERDERIIRLVAAGMTYDYIARAEGITRARVEQIVRREEVASLNSDAPKAG